MNNKMQEPINEFTDKVYDYILMEFNEVTRNSILVTEEEGFKTSIGVLGAILLEWVVPIQRIPAATNGGKGKVNDSSLPLLQA